MTFEEKVDSGLIYKVGDGWVDIEDSIIAPVCENCPANGDEDNVDICCNCSFNQTETNIEKIFEHYKKVNTNMWLSRLHSIKEWYRQEKAAESGVYELNFEK